MRIIFFSLLQFYGMVLIGQILADHNTAPMNKRNSNVDHLKPTRLREALVRNESKLELQNLATLPRDSSAPFRQSLGTYTYNFKAFCEGKNYQDDKFVFWEYSFVDATCDTKSGDPRRIKVSCHAWYNHRNGPKRWHPSGIKNFREDCPENSVCQKVIFINQRPGPPVEEVACVDEVDITTEQVTSANSHADPNAPDVHCSLSLAIPGTEFTVKPGVQSIDVTLTEEVRYKNGAPYPAPMLYIRDKTSWRGFDRVFRRHASVASTQVTLTAVNGKFQTRTFEFCMQLLPGLTASAVTFTHSWFQTTSRHGRIPEQRLLEQQNHNDTSQP